MSFITTEPRTRLMLCHVLVVSDGAVAEQLSNKLQDVATGAVKRERRVGAQRAKVGGAWAVWDGYLVGKRNAEQPLRRRRSSTRTLPASPGNRRSGSTPSRPR